MMEHFVVVDGLIAEVNYDHLRMTEKHDFHLPSGKRNVVVNVGFIRRDMSHTQAIALARERGFRPALLPETIPVIHGGNHQHLEEIFRAMMIAAQSRRKPWATNCLALACAAKDKFTPVQQIVHGEGRFEARVAFREIDPSALVPHLLGMTFVRV